MTAAKQVESNLVVDPKNLPVLHERTRALMSKTANTDLGKMSTLYLERWLHKIKNLLEGLDLIKKLQTDFTEEETKLLQESIDFTEWTTILLLAEYDRRE